jgi:hypothetical protein
VEGFPIRRHWYAVHPVGRQPSVVARAFLDFLLGHDKTSACAGDGGANRCRADCGPNEVLASISGIHDFRES